MFVSDWPERTSGAPAGFSGSSCEHCDPAALWPCPGRPASSTESPTTRGKPTMVKVSILLIQRQDKKWSLYASYLIVRVVKVHRLTESHFSFRPQVFQLDRTRELQDPTEKTKSQRSRGHRCWSALTPLNCLQQVKALPLLPFELELHSHIVLSKSAINTINIEQQTVALWHRKCFYK